MSKKITVFILAALFLVAGYGFSDAYQSYLTAFNNLYSTTGTALDSCVLCHISAAGGGTRNTYGNAFRGISTHSSNPTAAFVTIAGLDSDSDGFTNIVEITARSFPGNSGSIPSAPAACTSYTYSAWSACQVTNTQTRTVATSLPAGCTGGTAPVLSQTCTYVPPVTACTSYTYTLGACQSNNTAPVTSYTGIPAGCSGGATPATTQPCTYVPPVTACTSYTYTLGACQSNNTAPVTGYTGIPAGCSGGATPATSQGCTYVPPITGSLIAPATHGLYWDDTNTKLGINVDNPVSRLSVADESTVSNRGLTVSQHTSDRAAALINYRQSRGSNTLPAAVLDGDYTGTLVFRNYSGSAYLQNAYIGALVNGPVTPTSVPTELFFATSDTNDPD
ncbi:MAG: hypothetical protein WA610_06030, partial [Thermodesulfovibrionales bacterium]